MQLETLGLTDDAAWARTVTLTSSSAAGEFATDPTGPWSPSLTLSIGVGASTAGFYYLDTQAGTPTIVAALDDGSTTSQQENIGVPAAPPPPPSPPPPTTTQPAVTPSPVTTTTTPAASPPAPREPAAPVVAHVASVTTRRLHGHLVVSVRVRAGARATAHARVLIRVRRGSTTIALATRTTDAHGLATWRSPRVLEPGRYTATAAVRR